MSIETIIRTDVFAFADFSLYNSYLGDCLDGVNNEYLIQTMEQVGAEILGDVLGNYYGEAFKLGDGWTFVGEDAITVEGRGITSPKYYNFERETAYFAVRFPDNLQAAVMADYSPDFWQYMQDRFGTRDGFWSFMPYHRDKYSSIIEEGPDADDFGMAVSMWCAYRWDKFAGWMDHDRVQMEFIEDVTERGGFMRLDDRITQFFDDLRYFNTTTPEEFDAILHDQFEQETIDLFLFPADMARNAGIQGYEED